MKYIIITGSVMSGIGKGITASSIGVLLKGYGYQVTAIKIDGYLNEDSGTMSPLEHGECYVLKDGGETDLDLGNYERFLNCSLTRDHNLTTGKLYRRVLEDERAGKYLGKTVQIVPHLTDAIQEWIERVARIPVDNNKSPEICIIEIGGTVGDMEGLPYLEALRQLGYRLGPENVCFVNVSYIPVLKISNETKTKPTQEGIRNLRSYGINPDILCLRCERELTQENIDKLSNFCQIPKRNIIINQDVSNIYQIPLVFEKNGMLDIISEKLKLETPEERLPWFDEWQVIADKFDVRDQTVNIAVVGKYTGLTDSYLSLSHAVKHASMHAGAYAVIDFIEADTLTGDTSHNDDDNDDAAANGWDRLKQADAIIIPGGFGPRGIEGMIRAITYARENDVPCLGICLGMQLMVIEYARNVLSLEGANSTEFDEETPHPVITIMEEDQKIMGGTMRLGVKRTVICDSSSLASQMYPSGDANERHRHRYEVNPKYLDLFMNNEEKKKQRLMFTGKDETGIRMEIAELVGNHFHLGTQFHPEYQTYPDRPHPVFAGLLRQTLVPSPS